MQNLTHMPPSRLSLTHKHLLEELDPWSYNLSSAGPLSYSSPLDHYSPPWEGLLIRSFLSVAHENHDSLLVAPEIRNFPFLADLLLNRYPWKLGHLICNFLFQVALWNHSSLSEEGLWICDSLWSVDHGTHSFHSLTPWNQKTPSVALLIHMIPLSWQRQALELGNHPLVCLLCFL